MNEPTAQKLSISVAKPAIVIDTNVVLNWLFFSDPATVRIIEHLLSTHYWVFTPWMQREAQRVATTAQLAKYSTPSARAALAHGFDAHAGAIETTSIRPHPALRCRDADDQAFLDLAAHTQAPLLLSLDRDLLKLKKRAQSFGLNIVQPFKIML